MRARAKSLQRRASSLRIFVRWFPLDARLFCGSIGCRDGVLVCVRVYGSNRRSGSLIGFALYARDVSISIQRYIYFSF